MTYITQTKLHALVAFCNRHGAGLTLESRGGRHRLVKDGEPVAPFAKAAPTALYLQGFVASVEARTRRPRR